MSILTERFTCRACGSKALKQILDLGRTALANAFLTPKEAPFYAYYPPLELNLCTQCSLVQLRQVIDPHLLYSQYAYVTSTSDAMKGHLNWQRGWLMGLACQPRPSVLEIGSNNGANLKLYRDVGCQVCGIDPAKNLAELAAADGVQTIAKPFGMVTATGIGQFDLVVARHVFGHIDNWQEFFQALELVTHHKSIVAIEVPYLPDFFVFRQWDTVYHEHLSYISVTAVQAALKNTSFYLSRVQHRPIHCGSIVMILTRVPASGIQDGYGNDGKNVSEFMFREHALNLRDPQTWKPFYEDVMTVVHELPARIREWRAEGKRVAAYGASAKGTTLFNVCKLTPDDIEYVVDNTPFKQGKLCAGSEIPVVSPEHFHEDKPDITLVTAWNFYAEIVRKEAAYVKAGGVFVMPSEVAKSACATLTTP